MTTRDLLRAGIIFPLLLAGVVGFASVSRGCFGTMLKIAVEKDQEKSYAAYATGYFIAEKTGIEPDFVEVSDPGEALLKGAVDLALMPVSSLGPKNSVTRPATDLPGFGAAVFAIRSDVLEDIRFTTVEKALELCPAFFTSPAFRDNAQKGAEPKKAARKAVADGT